MATPSPVCVLVAALDPAISFCFRETAGEGESIPDDTVGALAKLLGNIVSLVNAEFLVEHLEYAPVLDISHDGRVWSRFGLGECLGERRRAAASEIWSREGLNGREEKGFGR